MHIPDALEYFDKNNEIYDKLARKIKYIQKDQKSAKKDGLYLSFFDSKKKFMFSSRVEILAKYFTQENLWIWGWAISTATHTHITLIKKLLLYGLDLDTEAKKDIIEMKNELVTSRTHILNYTQIEILCALAGYLAKQPMIYEIDNSPNLDDNQIHEISSSFLKKDNKMGDFQLFLFIVNPPEMF